MAALDRAPLIALPRFTYQDSGRLVPSFVSPDEANIHLETVRTFGEEWKRFGKFTDAEVTAGGDEYFADLLPEGFLAGRRVLDVGCGSGRWTRYLARRSGFVEAADPSSAALIAARETSGEVNVRVIHASVSSLPYARESFDLVASLGVLHHVPDTAGAIRQLVHHVKPGGQILLYLYYNLEGRPLPYRAAFHLARGLRSVISRLPSAPRTAASELAAVFAYLPLVLLARTLRRLAPTRRWYEHVPLHYYIDKPWKIVRNDALDRFGTPLEQRFSKKEIRGTLEEAGFEDIRFAEAMPRWRVLATRPHNGSLVAPG